MAYGLSWTSPNGGRDRIESWVRIWLESESRHDGPDVFLEVNGSFGDEMLNWRWQKKKQVCARQYKYRSLQIARHAMALHYRKKGQDSINR